MVKTAVFDMRFTEPEGRPDLQIAIDRTGTPII
jgi:hypothetical protein